MNITQDTTANQYKGRGGHVPDMIVCHIAENDFKGILDIFKDPATHSSATYTIAKDGRIVQLVDIENTSWCNGTSVVPSCDIYYGHSLSEIVKNRPYDCNLYSVTLEFEGKYAECGGKLEPAQYKAGVELVVFIINEIKRIWGTDFIIDREHITGHTEVNPVIRSVCPGEQFQFDDLIADVAKIIAAQK